MDYGVISLIASPILLFAGILITQFVVRRNAKDNIDLGRFEANLEAYENRAINAETRMAALEKDMQILKVAMTSQERQLVRIRTVVQRWFKELREAWDNGKMAMPVPTDEELELLGITIDKKRELK